LRVPLRVTRVSLAVPSRRGALNCYATPPAVFCAQQADERLGE
jgi:hypothetical protein